MSQKIHIRSASASNRVRPLAATQKYHKIFTPGEEVIKAATTNFVRYDFKQLLFLKHYYFIKKIFFQGSWNV